MPLCGMLPCAATAGAPAAAGAGACLLGQLHQPVGFNQLHKQQAGGAGRGEEREGTRVMAAGVARQAPRWRKAAECHEACLHYQRHLPESKGHPAQPRVGCAFVIVPRNGIVPIAAGRGARGQDAGGRAHRPPPGAAGGGACASLPVALHAACGTYARAPLFSPERQRGPHSLQRARADVGIKQVAQVHVRADAAGAPPIHDRRRNLLQAGSRAAGEGPCACSVVRPLPAVGCDPPRQPAGLAEGLPRPLRSGNGHQPRVASHRVQRPA